MLSVPFIRALDVLCGTSTIIQGFRAMRAKTRCMADPFSDPRIELCADDGVLEAYNAEGNLVYNFTTEGIK